LKVEVSKTGLCEVTLQIEVEAERVNEELEKIYRQLSQTIKMPGFRVNKAPRSIIEKRLGKQIKSEAVGQLLPEAYNKAMEDQGLSPISEPKFPDLEEINLKKDEPLAFKAVVVVEPEVVLGEYKGIEIKKIAAAQIGPQDVEKELERLRERHAQLTTPEESYAVQNGDLVILDYDLSDEGGGEIEHGKDQAIEVGNTPFAVGLSEGIVGLKKGDAKEVAVTFSEGVKEEFRGKKALYSLTLKEIRKKDLPALDDEFAKDVGEENLEALRAKADESLKRRDEAERQLRMEEEAISKLMEVATIEIPPLMIEKELDRMLPRREYSDLSDEEYAKLRSDSTELAVRRIKSFLILKEIARKENVSVRQEEIDEEINKMSLITRQDPAKVKAGFEKNDAIKDLEDRLKRRRALDLVLEHAIVREVKEA
jgi:trigger factor